MTLRTAINACRRLRVPDCTEGSVHSETVRSLGSFRETFGERLRFSEEVSA